ncbi:MAG TPA: hypothetical protein VG496_04025 [Myxococcales bacterium]|nr:hypothetical protein [Myxococcales bacterium]
MKTLKLAIVALSFVAAAYAQQSDPGSGSYSRSAQHKSKSSAAAKIGGSPTHPPELGSSAEGRARAGYDVGVASATAGGRTDTGPVGGTSARPRTTGQDQANLERNAAARQTPRGSRTDAALERLPARQPPTLANPTPEEIAAAQARGRIRDQEQPPPDLSEQDWPNPEGTEEAVDNPFQRRQKRPNP